MGVMPGWFAKLPELWRLDVYFSVADAGGPAELRKRYERVQEAIANGDFRASKFDPHKERLFSEKVMTHFEKDWVRGGKGGYFPSVTSSDAYDEEAYLVMQETAFGKAVELGINEGGDAKPLNISWICAPGTDFLGAAVSDGPSGVTLLFVTPPYVDPSAEPGYPHDIVRDKAWTWKLEIPPVEDVGRDEGTVQLASEEPLPVKAPSAEGEEAQRAYSAYEKVPPRES